jgi:hypothetical protein
MPQSYPDGAAVARLDLSGTRRENGSMTTHRRLLLFGLLAVAVVLATGSWLLWPRTAITRENAAKIQVGMTLAEVEAILGGPARSDMTGPCVVDLDDRDERDLLALQQRRYILLVLAIRGEDRYRLWQSDAVELFVQCDHRGRVTTCDTTPMRRAEESPIDMLRRWLRL